MGGGGRVCGLTATIATNRITRSAFVTTNRITTPTTSTTTPHPKPPRRRGRRQPQGSSTPPPSAPPAPRSQGYRPGHGGLRVLLRHTAPPPPRGFRGGGRRGHAPPHRHPAPACPRRPRGSDPLQLPWLKRRVADFLNKTSNSSGGPNSGGGPLSGYHGFGHGFLFSNSNLRGGHFVSLFVNLDLLLSMAGRPFAVIHNVSMHFPPRFPVTSPVAGCFD